MAVSPSDIARTIAAVVKNLNNRRVRCAGDAVNCLCRNDAYSALDSQLFLLSMSPLTALRRDERRLSYDCMPAVYVELELRRNGRPIAVVSIDARYDSGVVETHADVKAVYDEEVERRLCSALPNLSACVKKMASVRRRTILAQFLP